MNITIASKLMELYAACPKCGCEVIGNGKGLLECDTAAGFFKRSCGFRRRTVPTPDVSVARKEPISPISRTGPLTFPASAAAHRIP